MALQCTLFFIHYRHDGKRRIAHELKVHDFVYQEQVPSSHLPHANDAETEVIQDDMFNYQRNLMDHGMLYLNFTDAIREGDGERIIRCWKYLLLHFFADGDKSTKYAIEALFLQFQQQALLSPRQAYCQKWNRTINNHNAKGNIILIKFATNTSS